MEVCTLSNPSTGIIKCTAVEAVSLQRIRLPREKVFRLEVVKGRRGDDEQAEEVRRQRGVSFSNVLTHVP